MTSEDHAHPVAVPPVPTLDHLMIVDATTVTRLRGKLSCQSKECVMDTLGISSNTWTKMKRGEPVRRILVERAIQRLSLPTGDRA